jgi:hypothetical protein
MMQQVSLLTTYDGNATRLILHQQVVAAVQTDGYSTITVTGLPLSSNMRIRITMLNNAAAERWIIDDLQVQELPVRYFPLITTFLLRARHNQ